jgi:hypothetical protein
MQEAHRRQQQALQQQHAFLEEAQQAVKAAEQRLVQGEVFVDGSALMTPPTLSPFLPTPFIFHPG